MLQSGAISQPLSFSVLFRSSSHLFVECSLSVHRFRSSFPCDFFSMIVVAWWCERDIGWRLNRCSSRDVIEERALKSILNHIRKKAFLCRVLCQERSTSEEILNCKKARKRYTRPERIREKNVMWWHLNHFFFSVLINTLSFRSSLSYSIDCPSPGWIVRIGCSQRIEKSICNKHVYERGIVTTVLILFCVVFFQSGGVK